MKLPSYGTDTERLGYNSIRRWMVSKFIEGKAGIMVRTYEQLRALL
jgi:hypothetical protein